MNAVSAMGTFQLFDMEDWREAQAVAQAQAELEECAQIILWAIVSAFAFVLVGTVIVAVFA